LASSVPAATHLGNRTLRPRPSQAAALALASAREAALRLAGI
jgi:hypothetical protein